MYRKFIKRAVDMILSFAGLLVLSPVFIIVGAAIYIDNPGKILFTQKRYGKDKRMFTLHKFRSMKTETPDLPTHLLDNPSQYITRVGRFIRRFSIDELPQIYDIFIGNMSIIGPRPALWNQDDLIEQRDIYGANEIYPGLTGWAQINGRDELPIETKAKLDGEYARTLMAGGFSAFRMDVKCFFGTIIKVVKHEGVVEGASADKSEEAREVVHK